MDFSSRKAATIHSTKSRTIPSKSSFQRNQTDVSKYVSRPGVSALFYCDEMDFLISGYEDARVCTAFNTV